MNGAVLKAHWVWDPTSSYTWLHVQNFKFSRLLWNVCGSGSLAPRDGFWRSLSSWRDCAPPSVLTHREGRCRIVFLVCKHKSHFSATGRWHIPNVTVHLVDHCSSSLECGLTAQETHPRCRLISNCKRIRLPSFCLQVTFCAGTEWWHSRYPGCPRN